jgi:hypothetical protein
VRKKVSPALSALDARASSLRTALRVACLVISVFTENFFAFAIAAMSSASASQATSVPGHPA